jgi:hypothetical protein
MIGHMRRREFMVALGGLAAARAALTGPAPALGQDYRKGRWTAPDTKRHLPSVAVAKVPCSQPNLRTPKDKA